MSATAGTLPRSGTKPRTRAWRGVATALLWVAVIYTAVALLYAAQWGMELSLTGPVDWSSTLVSAALSWYTCAVASLPLVWLAWYHPLDTARLYRSIPIYVAAIAGASVVRFAIFVWLHNAIFGTALSMISQLRTQFIPEFVGFVSAVAVVTAIRYYRSAREREVHAAQLEGEVTQARLAALQTQLHPHFLFNTLHCVSTLMHRNVEQADEMLVRLCDLLRLTLERPERTEIALGDELAILERYLDIMEMRFPKQLHVRFDVPAELHAMPVPALLLQPLVENVLRHGLAEPAGTTDVQISAVRTERAIELSVVDNGKGLPTRHAPRFGTGLENTRRRLETLYGSDAALSIENATPSGTRVTLTIPLQPHA